MDLESLLLDKLPVIKEWINVTLNKYKIDSKSVLEFNFPRLSLYYSKEVLSYANVVAIDKIPVPPLSILGLEQLADFEAGNYLGITFINTYFLTSGQLYNETLHFHELVHIVQWKCLGLDRFLMAYGADLLKHKYKNSLLELMAYRCQERFEQENKPFNVEEAVLNELPAIVQDILKDSP